MFSDRTFKIALVAIVVITVLAPIVAHWIKAGA